MSEKIIGELNERTLHLSLKNYIEKDKSFHESEYEGYVIDIKRGNEIYEIETRSFSNISRKLPKLLEDNKVTVVYPVPEKIWVVYTDPKTGERSERRVSTKKGRASDVCSELYKIRKHILHPNFTLKLVFLNEERYKLRRGKRGGVLKERVPISYIGEKDYHSKNDFSSLVDVIPDGEFTASEFEKVNKLRGRVAWYAIQILLEAGVIEKTGQKGRAFVYKRS